MVAFFPIGYLPDEQDAQNISAGMEKSLYECI